MVKYFFDGQNPIGRQFRIDDSNWLDKPITIIGISHNAKDHSSGIRENIRPRFYMAYQQVPQTGQIAIEAQATGAPETAVAIVTSQIKSVDTHLPISFVRTLDRLVNDSAADQIALAKLSTFFAGLALLLACVGLYGVMSYTVAGRTREIGVRMALGARRLDVVRLVLREGLMLVTAGIVIGIPVSLASSRLLRSFLFEMRSTDPLSLTAVILMLGVVATFASFIPARRAAKVDPMVALRYE
jgi:putative ABC transport system permease protein